MADALATRACDLLGCRYPIVQTGMGWVSGANLTAATSAAGGFGILAAVTMDRTQMERAVRTVQEATDAPFGVNLRPDQPDLDERVRFLADAGVRLASFAGAPSEATIGRLHEAGVLVMPTVGARRHAEKMLGWGVDAVIAQGGEGGGHTGPVPTSLLLPAVVDAVGAEIDRIDQALLSLFAERHRYVTRMAEIKTDPHEAFDPDRIEAVIRKQRGRAAEIDLDEELALMEETLDLERRQLANVEQQQDLVQNQILGLAGRRAAIPAELSNRLANISRTYPNLKFDPSTGISKLDTDILFDTGSADLKPGAEQLLAQLAQVLDAPESRDLKILVAGHTDDRPVARKPARDKYDNNFDLSTERALAVASTLRRLGLGEHRIAVAGFGCHQPVAPNLTDTDRRKNRRAELFVMVPDVPVIGWTETTPGLY